MLDNLSFRTAGAIHVAWGGEFAMTGGLIQHCYTNGAGGGIQAAKTSCVTITSGAVRECYAAVGGNGFLWSDQRVRHDHFPQ